MRFMQATYFYIPLHLVSVLVATRALGLLRYAKRLERKLAEKQGDSAKPTSGGEKV